MSLSDENLMEVLKYWSYWEAPPSPAVPRRLELPESLDSSPSGSLSCIPIWSGLDIDS